MVDFSIILTGWADWLVPDKIYSCPFAVVRKTLECTFYCNSATRKKYDDFPSAKSWPISTIFPQTKLETKFYKWGTHWLTYYINKVLLIINYVILWVDDVCCESSHSRSQRPEASSVSLCQYSEGRHSFWTLLMITTLEMTMSWWQHSKCDHQSWFICFLLLWM